jgi:hypothetical protein
LSNGFDFKFDDDLSVSARRCVDLDGASVVELNIEDLTDGRMFLSCLCFTPEQALKLAAALAHEATLIEPACTEGAYPTVAIESLTGAITQLARRRRMTRCLPRRRGQSVPNSYAAECENGAVVAIYPNPEALTPHVGLHLSHLSGPNDLPCVLVGRLSPDDARAVGASLQQSADRVQKAWDEYMVEVKSDGELGD